MPRLKYCFFFALLFHLQPPVWNALQDAPVNDELLVFDPQDLEFLGPVQEAYTARTILIIVQKSAVSHLIFAQQ